MKIRLTADAKEINKRNSPRAKAERILSIKRRLEPKWLTGGRADVQTCRRADVQTCGRAGVRACGRADRTCGRADVRGCGRRADVVQTCGRAGVQACRRAGVLACGRAGVRACGRADVRCGRADVRTCGRADVRTCGRADVRTCGHGDVQTCGRADVRTCGRADVRTCGRADVRRCGGAEVRRCGEIHAKRFRGKEIQITKVNSEHVFSLGKSLRQQDLSDHSQAPGVSNAGGNSSVMSDQEREEHHEADQDAKEANNDFWSITANCTHWNPVVLGHNFSCANRRLGFPILRKYILTLTSRQLPAWTFYKREASAKSIIVRCVSILSDKMDMTYDHGYEHDDHDNTTSHYTPTTIRQHNKGWRSATDATLPGHREHPCGSRQGHPRYTAARSRGGRGCPDNRLET